MSPNPGEDLRPLARIVSGRRAVACHAGVEDDGGDGTEPGKTLIFDEVDAGIGGRVADVVGARLRRSGSDSRCCASRTCRRSRRGVDALPDRQAVRRDRTVTAFNARSTRSIEESGA